MTQLNSQIEKPSWPADYPIFISPMLLELRDRSKWTRSDAQEYFDWVMKSKVGRVRHLMTYTNHQELSSESLPQLASVVAHLISSSAVQSINDSGKFTNNNKNILCRVPDDAGLSIGADFGLFCAELAENTYPGQFEWAIGDGGKTNVFHGLPVFHALKEKRKYLHTSPIGAGVALAWGIAGGEKGEVLLELYEGILSKFRLSTESSQ